MIYRHKNEPIANHDNEDVCNCACEEHCTCSQVEKDVQWMTVSVDDRPCTNETGEPLAPTIKSYDAKNTVTTLAHVLCWSLKAIKFKK